MKDKKTMQLGMIGLGRMGANMVRRLINHLFQVLANLAMEPPIRPDSDSIRDAKVNVLKAIPLIEPNNIVRGQFQGYREEPGNV